MTLEYYIVSNINEGCIYPYSRFEKEEDARKVFEHCHRQWERGILEKEPILWKETLTKID